MTQPIKAWSDGVRKLTADQAKLVAESKLLSVEIDEPPDLWKLVANSRVGIVQGKDWEFRVEPRIEIPKLMFLLSYASDPDGWKESLAAFGEVDELFPALANGFSFLALRALQPAPVRGYTRIDELSQAFRGRIRIADQMARTLPIPLEITYDDYTIDTPENRALLGAAELLLRFPRITEQARKRLLRLRSLLDGVQGNLASSTPIPTTRLNASYAPALKLASLILAGASISTSKGKLESSSFVFDMNQVFEDFLAAALAESMRRFGGRIKSQYRDRHLDEERNIRLKPDLLWWKDGRARAVIDAKYKALSDNRFPNADAYQILAYCSGLSLPTGYLVYAKDESERPRNHTVVGLPVSIKVRTIDVEVEPMGLLEQVDALSEEIASNSADPLTHKIPSAAR